MHSFKHICSPADFTRTTPMLEVMHKRTLLNKDINPLFNKNKAIVNGIEFQIWLAYGIFLDKVSITVTSTGEESKAHKLPFHTSFLLN